MKEYRIGQYDKTVRGKKAVLTKEVQFMTQFVIDRKKMKKFPAGTEIVAMHEVFGTGLTTFTFNYEGRNFNHPVREGKFEYVN